VLSIRQPWAWLIVNGYKDIENRSWSTTYRGLLLIHASSKKPSADLLSDVKRDFRIKIPERYELGGIAGIAELVDCVRASRSRWMSGPIGWKLTNARPLPFLPVRGKLGLFRPSEQDMAQLNKRFAVRLL
jgi:hypothetical protein